MPRHSHEPYSMWGWMKLIQQLPQTLSSTPAALRNTIWALNDIYLKSSNCLFLVAVPSLLLWCLVCTSHGKDTGVSTVGQAGQKKLPQWSSQALRCIFSKVCNLRKEMPRSVSLFETGMHNLKQFAWVSYAYAFFDKLWQCPCNG